MKYYIFCVFLILSNINLFSQVNTEILRRELKTDTLINSISLLYSFSGGNSEYVNVGAGYRADCFIDDFYSFLSMQIDYKEASEVKNLNKGFIHFRTSYELNDNFSPEVFYQKEYNEFINLQDRDLFGGGMRLSYSDSSSNLHLSLGIGLMHESEDIATIGVNKALKSTNYLSLNYKPLPALSLSSVTYYQVKFDELRNFRILSDIKVEFELTSTFKFFTIINYRYNNLPLTNIQKYDITVSNGLKVVF